MNEERLKHETLKKVKHRLNIFNTRDYYYYYYYYGKIKIGGITGADKTYLKQKNCMLGNEESNNLSMIMNAAPIVCDKNQEFKFKSFFE